MVGVRSAVYVKVSVEWVELELSCGACNVFVDLETAEELYQRRITRIITTDFPQYFAVVSRIREESSYVGREGGMLSSTVVPQVQAQFPEGALTKQIKVGLQVRQM